MAWIFSHHFVARIFSRRPAACPRDPIKLSIIALLTFVLLGCGGRENLAPIVELNWRESNRSAAHSYVVKRGDTLYAIAFRYDLDYRRLAAANHLNSPYVLRVGQVIQIGATRTTRRAPRYYSSATVPKVTYSTPIPHQSPFSRFSRRNSAWNWPAQGKVVASFVPTQGKKGIDIAGKKGDKIYAAQSGVVAYAGSGLSGYGNLIIIRHENQYLTAYGHNEKNLVSEGQVIKAGQVIADMGLVDRRYWGLHFEIRQSGTPVNPLNYLK